MANLLVFEINWGCLMKIFHMLWLPFAYRFFPYWLANRALRGTLKHYGLNVNLFSNELTQELSKRIIDRQKLHARKPSVFKQLYDLQLLIDFDAITIKKLTSGELKYEFEMTPEINEVKDIVFKHAVKKLKQK